MNIQEKTINTINDFLKSKNKKYQISKPFRNISLTDLGLDSIEYIELIVYLEKAFNCEFEDFLLNQNKLKDIKSIVTSVNERLS